MEIGMPVSIRPNSSRKMMSGVGRCTPTKKSASGTTTMIGGSVDQNRSAGLIAGPRPELRPDAGCRPCCTG